MKKLTRIIAAAAIAMSFTAGSSTIASAKTSGVSSATDLCKELVELGIYDSVGQCISQGLNKAINDYCAEFWDDEGFKNRGQCQSFYRHVINDIDF